MQRKKKKKKFFFQNTSGVESTIIVFDINDTYCNTPVDGFSYLWFEFKARSRGQIIESINFLILIIFLESLLNFLELFDTRRSFDILISTQFYRSLKIITTNGRMMTVILFK